MFKLDSNHPARKEASRLKERGRATDVALVVVMPALWAGLGVFSTILWSDYYWLVLLCWLLAIVLHGLFWFRSYPSDSSVFSLTVENFDLRADHAELKALLENAKKWVFHSIAALTLRQMTVAACRGKVTVSSDLIEFVGDALSPLYLNGGEVLGFEASERWSIGVYLYFPDKDQLQQIWREKSRNHPSGEVGRSWGRGQGHVGKAFVDGKPIITGDAAHPDVIQLCGAPAMLHQNYDVEIYRSFASIPIGPFDEEGALPYGVLVATSDRQDRFDADSGLLLMHFADSIGVVIALGEFSAVEASDVER
ncbi:hypothetical protein J2T09_002379 [Neorhizobium huautlense]|uniref:GAF domain-containing protein n=1 Tax=Neorhizobium huautlense TaxID=67774 RepID=A0ABT9PT36_9HYPH|nr:GAF domain-containing protein [Neorhizobium huautlense]MDP9837627.1 hypothetical protein [Neorhizobium huautlense]